MEWKCCVAFCIPIWSALYSVQSGLCSQSTSNYFSRQSLQKVMGNHIQTSLCTACITPALEVGNWDATEHVGILRGSCFSSELVPALYNSDWTVSRSSTQPYPKVFGVFHCLKLLPYICFSYVGVTLPIAHWSQCVLQWYQMTMYLALPVIWLPRNRALLEQLLWIRGIALTGIQSAPAQNINSH